MPTTGRILPIGKGRVVRRAGGNGPGINGLETAGGPDSGRGATTKDRVCILSFGTRLHDSLVAAQEAEASDPTLGVTVADARFMKPLDVDLVRELASEHSAMVFVEEGSIGGFGDHVLHFLALDGALDDGNLKVRPMIIPDAYIETGTQHEQYEETGLNARHIKGTVLRLAY